MKVIIYEKVLKDLKKIDKKVAKNIIAKIDILILKDLLIFIHLLD